LSTHPPFSEALNYIPVFIPLATQNQTFFTTHPEDPQQQRPEVFITNQPPELQHLLQSAAAVSVAKPSTIAP
ncbi:MULTISPECIES: hypothetical protein, partial [unclassified Acidovorax]|uniref:hypothetical protein n=1 Tax=unclassified Acidovorax TaxID=2684926 RepID=UPI001F430EFD